MIESRLVTAQRIKLCKLSHQASGSAQCSKKCFYELSAVEMKKSQVEIRWMVEGKQRKVSYFKGFLKNKPLSKLQNQVWLLLLVVLILNIGEKKPW